MLRVPALATAVIAAVLAIYVALGVVDGQRKLAALEPVAAPGSYRITLAFAPERFHQVLLQDRGRLVEVRDDVVYMKDVAPKALRDIAREYWVTSIERWDGS
jgi:hypothetical protein